jgi:hypothetical protein
MGPDGAQLTRVSPNSALATQGAKK